MPKDTEIKYTQKMAKFTEKPQKCHNHSNKDTPRMP